MPIRRRRVATGVKLSQGGRGALLENMLNLTNDIYRRTGRAMVQKIPTPITPISMEGPTITRAFFAEKSTVDYVGVWKGHALCFDAKECHQTTFPLKNIHEHQLQFMRDFAANGGTAFLILYYTETDSLYFMPIEEIEQFTDRSNNGGRKSFRMDELKEEHFFTTSDVPVPYLSVLEKLTKEEKRG